MKLNLLLTVLTFSLYIIVIKYWPTGSCAGSLNSVRYLHHGGGGGDPGNTNIFGHGLSRIGKIGNPQHQKQIPPPTLNSYLEETFGHDPFIYGWFSNTTTQWPNYQVHKMIGDLFRKSSSFSDNEILEVFLAGGVHATINDHQPIIEQRQGATNAVPFVDGPSVGINGDLNVDETPEGLCRTQLDLENSRRVSKSHGKFPSSNSTSPTIPSFPPGDDYEVPEGCHFYDVHENYLICNKTAMKVIPKLPEKLDIFEMYATNAECIHSKAFSNVQVQIVKLAENRIVGVATNGFKDVAGLKHLFLNQNKLRAPIWFTSYKGLEELELLDLDRNKISMDRLRDLRDDEVYKELEEEQSKGPYLTSLKYLSMKHNPIGFIPDWFFQRFNGTSWLLLTILLSGCNLYHIEENAFSHFSRIFLLELNENPNLMPNLTIAARGLARAKIQKLALQYNGLTSIPKEALEIMEGSLTGLDITGNTLIRLEDESFPEMSKLTALNMENCQISSISANAFNRLAKLDTISLKGNVLTRVPPAIGALVNLNTLILTGNNDEKVNQFTIPPGAFEHLGKLRSLFMNDLKIRSINSTMFEGLVKLKLLHMTNSRLETIADGTFIHLKNLEYLDMKGNPLASINSNTFLGLENLTSLYLPDCGLSFSPDKALVRHASPFTRLNNLRYLILSGNRIAEIYPALFANLTYLSYLDLGRNRIQAWHEPIFESHTALQNLYLSYNQLTTTSDAMLKDFKTVQNVTDLAENPFFCDLGICGLKAAVGNGSLRVHEWEITDRHQCLLSNPPPIKVRIASLSDEYCKGLGA